jgi:hypothetical protein
MAPGDKREGQLKKDGFESRPKAEQDWFLKCLQGGRAHNLAIVTLQALISFAIDC